MKKVILIAQRGWVFIGDLTQAGTKNKLTNASCIRRWGTTKGLGQLALDGPQSGTSLDPVGEIEVHELATVGIITVKNPDQWK